MKLLTLIFLCIFTSVAFAAGTLTTTRTQTQLPSGKIVDIVQIDWTSDASGNADVAVTLNGYLIKAITDPGSTAPTDDYDITLVQNGVDAAATLLTNRDTANSEQVYPLVSGAATPIFLVGSHTFTVANAGNAKVGTAYFYLIDSL